jgi:opacity protein-like surface antigen
MKRVRLICHRGVAGKRTFAWGWFEPRLFLVALLLSIFAGAAQGQTAPGTPLYSRLNTFGFFGAYSNDSSHILLGITEQRKLLNIGGVYNRRLLENNHVVWQYSAEVQPVALESDPVEHQTIIYTSPAPATYHLTIVPFGACHTASGGVTQVLGGKTYTYTYTNQCSRQWTIGEGMSPIGFQWNFRPHHKLQPIVTGHGGYMYSTQPIPVANAGSFNFTFDVGAGLELYRSKTRSIRAEYRYHHISNHFTANENPGIDNGLFQVTYAFGR